MNSPEGINHLSGFPITKTLHFMNEQQLKVTSHYLSVKLTAPIHILQILPYQFKCIIHYTTVYLLHCFMTSGIILKSPVSSVEHFTTFFFHPHFFSE